MLLGGKGSLEFEVCVESLRLEHLSEFKYFGYVLDESGTDVAGCSRHVASGSRVASYIRFLVNTRGFSFSVLGSCMNNCS